MSGFAKLFSDIVDSSIWDEDPPTCKVWVTMLALADPEGYVRGSVGWLAKKSRVSEEQCSIALGKFESPDPSSRTPDDDGRRVRTVERGWLIINFIEHRNRRVLSDDPRKVYQREWVRKKRASVDKPVDSVNTVDKSRVYASVLSVSCTGGFKGGSSEANGMEIEQLKKEISAMFLRDPETRWNHSDEHALFELVNQAPGKMLGELKVIQARMQTLEPSERKFYVKSVKRLLEDWPRWVDEARVMNNAHKALNDPMNPPLPSDKDPKHYRLIPTEKDGKVVGRVWAPKP